MQTTLALVLPSSLIFQLVYCHTKVSINRKQYSFTDSYINCVGLQQLQYALTILVIQWGSCQAKMTQQTKKENKVTLYAHFLWFQWQEYSFYSQKSWAFFLHKSANWPILQNLVCGSWNSGLPHPNFSSFVSITKMVGAPLVPGCIYLWDSNCTDAVCCEVIVKCSCPKFIKSSELKDGTFMVDSFNKWKMACETNSGLGQHVT